MLQVSVPDITEDTTIQDLQVSENPIPGKEKDIQTKETHTHTYFHNDRFRNRMKQT